MKVFAVSGVTGSGKTTVIEHIIGELKSRGYRVGSVKDIHYEDFAMDQEGSNTWRHVQAGSELVVARGFKETDMIIPRRMDYEELLTFFSHGFDYVVMEGMAEAKVPRILCAHTEQELSERWSHDVFAVSGRIGEIMNEFRGVPVIDVLKDAQKLVDLVEAKVKSWKNLGEVE